VGSALAVLMVKSKLMLRASAEEVRIRRCFMIESSW